MPAKGNSTRPGNTKQEINKFPTPFKINNLTQQPKNKELLNEKFVEVDGAANRACSR